jgi:hypothetical protein
MTVKVGVLAALQRVTHPLTDAAFRILLTTLLHMCVSGASWDLKGIVVNVHLNAN